MGLVLIYNCDGYLRNGGVFSCVANRPSDRPMHTVAYPCLHELLKCDQLHALWPLVEYGFREGVHSRQIVRVRSENAALTRRELFWISWPENLRQVCSLYLSDP